MDDFITWSLIAGLIFCMVVCFDRLFATKEEVLCVWTRELRASTAINGKDYCTVGFVWAKDLRGYVRVPQKEYEQIRSGQMIHVRCRVSPLFKTKFNFTFDSL